MSDPGIAASRKRGTRGRLDRTRLEAIVNGFSRIRLLVVGDVVLDEYLRGDVDRVSPEAPVPVVHVSGESQVLGGAGNVVRNVVALGASSRFCAVVGSDRAGMRVLDLLKDLGVDVDGVVVVEGRPTTRKTRVVARTQQIVRFDRETIDAPGPDAIRRLLGAIAAAIPGVDGVVLEDYGKGALVPRVIAAAMRRFRAAGLFVAVDPKHTLQPFRGASLLKPNLREAEALAGLRVHDDATLSRAAERLRRRIGGGDVAITCGSEGIAIFGDSIAAGERVRTAPREVFDVQGAGDTTIAALTLALRAGATLREAAVIANAAAGVVVAKAGTATASRAELLRALPAAIAAADGEVLASTSQRGPAARVRRKT